MEKRTCSIGGCEDPVKARGWCSRHYWNARVYGAPLGGPLGGRRRTDPRGCSVEGCPKPHYGRGWCLRHWTSWHRHGDPEWVTENHHRTYALNDHFFDVIDTEAKAYWLGFITADGCVHAGRVGTAGWQRHAVTVKLKASDAGHLEKLKADLSAQSPVYPVPRGNGTEIALSSMRLVESLIRLGVTPRKSLTATPWNGPDDLMRHYWRGMFDGDGSIGRFPGPRDKWYLKLCGTEACVEAFKGWASPICGSAASCLPKDNIWTWSAAGLASPQLLAHELYGGAKIYLDRKHELALQLMAAPIRHRSWLRPDGAE